MNSVMIVFLIIVILILVIIVLLGIIRKDAEEREQLKIVGALCSGYPDVFLLEPAKNITSSVKVHGVMIKNRKRIERDYTAVWNKYISEYVLSEDAEFVRKKTASDSIMGCFENPYEFSMYYRVIHKDKVRYMQVRFVRLSEDSDKIIAGFRNTDTLVEKEIKRREALQEALESAENASNAKTAFLTSISHDIRTPMNAIISYTSLALMRPNDSDYVSDYLSKILVSGEHLMALINDVLDMSRIEAGSVRSEAVPVFLPDVIKDAGTIVQAAADAEKIDFSVSCDNIDNPDVFCDKLHLHQILINILGNAVKFTGEGGSVELVVSQKPYEDGINGEYEFRIKDSGIGMSPEFREHIFEMFSREETSTVSGIEGTGLGMAITRSLVEMMNGTIEVSSEQGIGTEFVVIFHFRILDGTARINNANRDSEFFEDGDINEAFTGKSVLIVEDNEVNQEIAAELLKKAGFTVDIAADGAEAVKKIADSVPGQYDLVLMDIQMPVMDGYEATRIIRSMQESCKSEIPIIAMTANAFEEDRKKAFDAGMNAHLLKPIRIGEFLRTISRFVMESKR